MSKSRKVKIGHLCSKGHFDFTADPEHGTCATKNVGNIYVELDPRWGKRRRKEALAEAQRHLSDVLEIWRYCECGMSGKAMDLLDTLADEVIRDANIRGDLDDYTVQACAAHLRNIAIDYRAAWRDAPRFEPLDGGIGTDSGTDPATLKAAVERSSLGTPEASAARAAVTAEDVAEVQGRVAEMASCEHRDTWFDEVVCACGLKHVICSDCDATLEPCAVDPYVFLSDGTDDGEAPTLEEFKRMRRYLASWATVPQCPKCFRGVSDEDDHLRGDKGKVWFECPEDGQP